MFRKFSKNQRKIIVEQYRTLLREIKNKCKVINREKEVKVEEHNSSCHNCKSTKVIHRMLSDCHFVNRCADCEHEWSYMNNWDTDLFGEIRDIRTSLSCYVSKSEHDKNVKLLKMFYGEVVAYLYVRHPSGFSWENDTTSKKIIKKFGSIRKYEK